MVENSLPEEKAGWWQRLKQGLSKSSSKLTDSITGIFTKRRLDQLALNELEETLITADIGPAVAAQLVNEFGRTRFGKDVTDQEVRQALAAQMTEILQPVAVPLNPDFVQHRPFVILMVGVNGAGKTTTLGKIAHHYQQAGKKVLLVAADTFRAAAVSQLEVWAQRSHCAILTGAANSDPAALAFQGIEKAQGEQYDLVLIDTAGRLHNKEGLMQELAKIIRVIQKKDPTAPHAVMLVLDATSGQNAHQQVEAFQKIAPLTGLILTKLDGSSRGGVLLSLAQRFKLPVHMIGVGESIEDLKDFSARDFSHALMGLSEEEMLHV